MCKEDYDMVGTFSYGGVNFWFDYHIHDKDEWEIGEIYVDTEWPYKHGLYDALRPDVVQLAHDEVARIAAEGAVDGMDLYKARIENA